MTSMDIVLVHGAGGTPTTWAGVEPLLTAAGHHVVMVTNPMTSLEDDVVNTTAAIDGFAGDGPVLLVGHSYGGAVITNAGRHPRTAGLVYVAAFAPDQGESVSGIVEGYEPAEVSKHMRRGPDGEWASEHTDAYWEEIAWDLTPEQREIFDGDSRPSADLIFSQPTGVPAWRSVPSWYLVAAQDMTLRTEIQRDMAARMGATVSELPGSHFTTVVHPVEVTALITSVVESLGRQALIVQNPKTETEDVESPTR